MNWENERSIKNYNPKRRRNKWLVRRLIVIRGKLLKQNGNFATRNLFYFRIKTVGKLSRFYFRRQHQTIICHEDGKVRDFFCIESN